MIKEKEAITFKLRGYRRDSRKSSWEQLEVGKGRGKIWGKIDVDVYYPIHTHTHTSA